MEKQGKLGNKSQESLSREMFPIWNEHKGDQNWMKPYIEKYQEWRKQSRGGGDFKFDTLGRCLADIQNESKLEQRRKDDMETEIEKKVASLGVSGVMRAPFFIVHCNYLCRTDKDFYPPCEMAVAEFTLERGVTRVWQIVASLFNFMGSEEEGPLQPLYVAPHHQVAASCILDFLLAKSAASKKIKLFSLPKLMLEVYNLPLDPADVDGRMTVHVATSVLETDEVLALWWHWVPIP